MLFLAPDNGAILSSRVTDSINGPTKPIIRRVTRWLGRKRITSIAIRRRGRKIIVFRGHARDYVLATRVVRIDGFA